MVFKVSGSIYAGKIGACCFSALTFDKVRKLALVWVGAEISHCTSEKSVKCDNGALLHS